MILFMVCEKLSFFLLLKVSPLFALIKLFMGRGEQTDQPELVAGAANGFHQPVQHSHSAADL